MKYLTVAFIVVAGILFMTMPAYADEGEPTDESRTALGSEFTYQEIPGNPYGCDGISHYPHESTVDPGRGWIQAKADITCDIAPPLGSEWRMIQILYRSSYLGWVQIAVKYSECPIGTGNPDCSPTDMRAYIKWQCFKGVTYYNYRQVTRHRLIVGDDSYSARTAVQTGDWDEPGTVKCTNNS